MKNEKYDKCMKCGKPVYYYQIENGTANTNWKGMSAHIRCEKK